MKQVYCYRCRRRHRVRRHAHNMPIVKCAFWDAYVVVRTSECTGRLLPVGRR